MIKIELKWLFYYINGWNCYYKRDIKGVGRSDEASAVGGALARKTHSAPTGDYHATLQSVLASFRELLCFEILQIPLSTSFVSGRRQLR